jgi:glutathione S-transferase
MADYVLHCFAQSGNAYKPALMLELTGADWTPRFVDYFGGETRTPAYRALNVMGEVPVLEHGGKRLAQSGVILDYLAGALGQFGAKDDDERRDILRWILFDNHKLTSYTATYRFMRTFATDPDQAVLAEFRKRAETAWSILDAHLDGRRYVVADRLTIADLSLCGYLFWPEEIGVDWDHYPHLRDWLERLRGTPGWVHPYALMPGHPRPAVA